MTLNGIKELCNSIFFELARRIKRIKNKLLTISAVHSEYPVIENMMHLYINSPYHGYHYPLNHSGAF